ncbi:ABC transporter substrate-binding protein [Falsiroseomonas tokyonensis]|uniref:ABC transporter substrate-binding protein n=1 Tax=Falsiroseomonas tokyonensis TaxID=430521 RepID=A0ABV7BU51_9PROT|nr:ABC transporter substrate-binding protein [Falsiroseomonas tokyonensis]MBU8538536.1 carbohydrate ABC transporter substrate-binding protein [Falsiroseomonas tokyonensis]
MMGTSKGFTRRSLGLGVAGLAAAGVRPAEAQQTTLRWWSPQTAPAQREAYNFQIRSFEEANPGVRVVFEATSDEGYPAQMAAAFASGQVPSVVTHLPHFAVATYWQNGLLEPMNDVISAVGTENYYDGANRIYEITQGQYAGTGIGNSAANMMWLRTDLMRAAGVDAAPRTWDQLRDLCRRTQRGGIYGAPLPYARNSMTSLIFICFVHGAGGQIFTPDLQVAVDSDAFRNALEFYKSMREFCPPGATNYSWGESLTGFVAGATATGIYTGRVLANVAAQNPRIADSITCAEYPTISASVPHWTFNDFPSVMIPKVAPNMALAKRFAAHLFRADGYIRQLHAAPGHVLPVLKTISAMPAYQENALIQKYRAEVDRMSTAAAAGHNLGWESTSHKPNTSAGRIIASHVLAEAVQRYVVNNEPVAQVVSTTAQRLEQIMRG